MRYSLALYGPCSLHQVSPLCCPCDCLCSVLSQDHAHYEPLSVRARIAAISAAAIVSSLSCEGVVVVVIIVVVVATAGVVSENYRLALLWRLSDLLAVARLLVRLNGASG